MAPHLVQFELPWRDQRMWQRHLQSGIIDYVYNNSCVSWFDKSSWERPNGDHAVTLSALCNVFLPAPQNQCGGCTLELGEVTQAWIILKGFAEPLGEVKALRKNQKGTCRLRFSSESPWLWTDLIADVLLFKLCSEFHLNPLLVAQMSQLWNHAS